MNASKAYEFYWESLYFKGQDNTEQHEQSMERKKAAFLSAMFNTNTDEHEAIVCNEALIKKILHHAMKDDYLLNEIEQISDNFVRNEN